VSIRVYIPAFGEYEKKVMVIVILDLTSEDISKSEIQISPFAVFKVIYSQLSRWLLPVTLQGFEANRNGKVGKGTRCGMATKIGIRQFHIRGLYRKPLSSLCSRVTSPSHRGHSGSQYRRVCPPTLRYAP
jgi:hypothetical protein